MFGRNVRIGKIAGIPVGISPWWLAIVALITWSLGDAYFPEVIEGIAPLGAYALGLASALLLFASILAHEFGHAIVARRHGIEVEEIDLWLLGGVSRMRNEAKDPDTELRYALAGPAVTAVIAACFGAIAALLPSGSPAALRALVDYQLIVNALILGFNMLPAFPLDGGRVLRSLLWRRSGDLQGATSRAASVGRGFGYVMIFLGGLEFIGGAPQGIWLVLVGFFIVMAAGSQAVGAQVQAAFADVHARELMSTPAISIPARTSAAQAASDYFMPYRFTAFPVLDEEGHAIGMLSLDQIQQLTRQQRAGSWVTDIAERDPGLILAPEDEVTQLLERPSFARVGRAVVVDEDRHPLGLVSITDVQRALRASRLAHEAAGANGAGTNGSSRAAA